MQPNFMNDSIRTFIHTKQVNTHTHNPNNQNNDINVDFTINTKFMLLQLTTETTQILQYSYLNSARNWPISYISSITNFVHLTDPQKSVLGLLSNFVHFIHPYMNPLPEQNIIKVEFSYWMLILIKKHLF